MTILLTRLFTIRGPVGFKLPASNAFTGFTTTGESVSSSTQVNGTWSSSEKGWYFYTNSEKTQSIFFPALGYRSYSTMRPGSIGTQGSGRHIR